MDDLLNDSLSAVRRYLNQLDSQVQTSWNQLVTAVDQITSRIVFKQLSKTQIVLQSNPSGGELYSLIINGSNLSIAFMTGRIDSARLYRGGSFSNGTLTGGTLLGQISFSTNQIVLTTGGYTLTLSGSLPNTVADLETVFDAPETLPLSAIRLSQGNNELFRASLAGDGRQLVLSFPTLDRQFNLTTQAVAASLLSTVVGQLLTDGYSGGDAILTQIQVSTPSNNQELVNRSNLQVKLADILTGFDAPLLDLATVDDNGPSSSDHITSQTSGLTISGSGGRIKAPLWLFDDQNGNGVMDTGEELTTTMLASSSWRSDIALTIGTHSIRSRQSDDNGVIQTTSDPLTIVVTTAEAMGIRYRLNNAPAITGRSVVGSSKSDTVTLMSSGTPLTVVAIEKIVGSSAVDAIRLDLAASVTTSGVETVLGSTGTDSLTLLSAGQVAVSDVESVTGTSTATDRVVLLTAGHLATKAIETVLGSSGSDTLTLMAASKLLVTGVEKIIGSSASDTITLSSSQETIVFTLNNRSNDTLNNFGTNDLLVFKDMQVGQFAYLGSAAFSGSRRSEARMVTAKNQLQIDLDGNKTVDMQLTLPKVVRLSEANFSWSDSNKRSSVALGRVLSTMATIDHSSDPFSVHSTIELLQNNSIPSAPVLLTLP
ncbi:MAG: hypothetical protein HQL58_08580 [Magnetococcales bacterium]|nr:hypothetical protein [Magnetococcales bacterium]